MDKNRDFETKTKRKAISLTLDEDTLKNLEKVREETGIPISQQISLALKGYLLVKKEVEVKDPKISNV